MQNKKTSQVLQLEAEISRLKKVNQALIERVEKGLAKNNSAFALFESNILLEKQVKERTANLIEKTNELKGEKNKLTHIISALPGLIVIFDQKYEIIENYLKDFDEEAIIDIKTKKFKKAFLNEIQTIASAHNSKKVLEFNFLTKKDNKKLFFNCFVTHINKDQLVLFALNSTEKYIQEKIIKNQQAQLIQSSKLTAIGEMAGGIAHEVNTPLGIISLLASQLNKAELGDDVNSCAEQILETTFKISKIIKKLRIFSGESSTENFEICNLSEITSETLELCQEKYKAHGVNIIIKNSQDYFVFANKVQLSQVLLSLINNAYEATKANNEKWIKIFFKKIEYKVRVYVVDSGLGIQESILEKIYNPFFTTKDIGKGMGLGLSTSKKIIEKHNGDIFYEPQGKNTAFCIELNLKS